MQRLIRSFTVAALLVSTGWACADENASPSITSTDEGDSGKTLILHLSDWAGCPARDLSSPVPTLCSKPGGGIDASVGALLTEILNTQLKDKPTLCIIDSAIVEAQSQCLSGTGARSVFKMADLMIRLAYDWGELRQLDRADELARQANALLQAVRADPLQRMSALRAWAIVEIQRGKLQHAAELADLETDFARKWYEAVPDSAVPLTEALDFKASILEKLGRSSDAQSAREEAASLGSK